MEELDYCQSGHIDYVGLIIRVRYAETDFYRPLASSMFAPGVPQVMRDFKSTNTELASFVVSIYILGFAIGPM